MILPPARSAGCISTSNSTATSMPRARGRCSLWDAVEGSAAYVALEVVSGTLAGRRGSFVLQHTDEIDGTPSLTVSVVPDSGTDQLTGLAGKMAIIIEGKKHSFKLRHIRQQVTVAESGLQRLQVCEQRADARFEEPSLDRLAVDHRIEAGRYQGKVRHRRPAQSVTTWPSTQDTIAAPESSRTGPTSRPSTRDGTAAASRPSRRKRTPGSDRGQTGVRPGSDGADPRLTPSQWASGSR